MEYREKDYLRKEVIQKVLGDIKKNIVLATMYEINDLDIGDLEDIYFYQREKNSEISKNILKSEALEHFLYFIYLLIGGYQTEQMMGVLNKFLQINQFDQMQQNLVQIFEKIYKQDLEEGNNYDNSHIVDLEYFKNFYQSYYEKKKEESKKNNQSFYLIEGLDFFKKLKKKTQIFTQYIYFCYFYINSVVFYLYKKEQDVDHSEKFVRYQNLSLFIWKATLSQMKDQLYVSLQMYLQQDGKDLRKFMMDAIVDVTMDQSIYELMNVDKLQKLVVDIIKQVESQENKKVRDQAQRVLEMIQACVDQAISLFSYEKFVLLAKQIGTSEEYKKHIPQKLQNIAACFIEFLFQTQNMLCDIMSEQSEFRLKEELLERLKTTINDLDNEDDPYCKEIYQNINIHLKELQLTFEKSQLTLMILLREAKKIQDLTKNKFGYDQLWYIDCIKRTVAQKVDLVDRNKFRSLKPVISQYLKQSTISLETIISFIN